jgi:hypothetical protein
METDAPETRKAAPQTRKTAPQMETDAPETRKDAPQTRTYCATRSCIMHFKLQFSLSLIKPKRVTP